MTGIWKIRNEDAVSNLGSAQQLITIRVIKIKDCMIYYTYIMKLWRKINNNNNKNNNVHHRNYFRKCNELNPLKTGRKRIETCPLLGY
jgi:uncharacterized membrane protein